MGKRLTGMKEICDYSKKSYKTVTWLIRERQYPAVKIGGEWVSDTDLIDIWWRDEIAASMGSRSCSVSGAAD